MDLKLKFSTWSTHLSPDVITVLRSFFSSNYSEKGFQKGPFPVWLSACTYSWLISVFSKDQSLTDLSFQYIPMPDWSLFSKRSNHWLTFVFNKDHLDWLLFSTRTNPWLIFYFNIYLSLADNSLNKDQSPIDNFFFKKHLTLTGLNFLKCTRTPWLFIVSVVTCPLYEYNSANKTITEVYRSAF